MAIVSLGDQRITVYGVAGKISQAPVSTGSTGYETPAGIYSVVQKEEFHQSNLYEDGDMPFMQRITWTGIALHAGALPGHPASHGCIRMPMSFAEPLYGITEMGMRVIVVRDDMAPSDISHPALFKSRPVGKGLALPSPAANRSSASGVRAAAAIAFTSADAEVAPGSAQHLELLKSIAAAKSAELQAAIKREREAKQVAAKKAAEEAPAIRSLRAAEANHAKAEAQLTDAERRLEAATSAESVQQAEAAKASALARVAAAQTQLDTAKLQTQAKADAGEHARAVAQAATAARESAEAAAADAERNTAPVSVFISRRTQRLYVRKANYPIYEGPVTIHDADQPIGTFVFTALGPANTSGEMRWSVVSMYPNPTSIVPLSQERRGRANTRNADASPTDMAAARAALDRISIPKETIERISEVVLPGSSLIVSDEAASRETGKDTDFVVLMSGEPQGALKARQREPRPQYDDEYSWRRPPYRDFPFLSSSKWDRPRRGGWPW
jgi:lipoprotein-anchoring transpeptidase ErfK/SrfK